MRVAAIQMHGPRTAKLAALAVGVLWAGGAMCGPGLDTAQPPRPNRPPPDIVTLKGVISGLGVVQIEPAETPQASFILTYVDQAGRKAQVIVSMPARAMRCFDGEEAEVRGDFLPPLSDGLPAALGSAQILSCRPVR
jgi:hypothetical protein